MADPTLLVAQQQVRLGISQVEARLAKNRSTIYRWYKDGKFPVPHFIGSAVRVWWLHEIEAWERAEAIRHAARQAAAAAPNPPREK